MVYGDHALPRGWVATIGVCVYRKCSPRARSVARGGKSRRAHARRQLLRQLQEHREKNSRRLPSLSHAVPAGLQRYRSSAAASKTKDTTRALGGARSSDRRVGPLAYPVPPCAARVVPLASAPVRLLASRCQTPAARPLLGRSGLDLL